MTEYAKDMDTVIGRPSGTATITMVMIKVRAWQKSLSVLPLTNLIFSTKIKAKMKLTSQAKKIKIEE
jgi:hypothetical protein